jgi:hypothetical protein
MARLESRPCVVNGLLGANLLTRMGDLEPYSFLTGGR